MISLTLKAETLTLKYFTTLSGVQQNINIYIISQFQMAGSDFTKNPGFHEGYDPT